MNGYRGMNVICTRDDGSPLLEYDVALGTIRTREAVETCYAGCYWYNGFA